MRELEAIYDTRQSFYGKAKVEVQKNDFEQIKDLYSYDTLVASVVINFDKKEIKYIYGGKYSRTTTRHQKEFFKQEGLSNREIQELFKEVDNTLIKELI